MTCKRGNNTVDAFISILLMLLMVLLPVAARGDYYASPNTNTTRWADYLVNLKIGAITPETGDEVAFFDPRGALCGHFTLTVETAAQEYFPVTVYGSEAAVNGEVLSVRIWDASAGVELRGSSVILTSGPALGESFQPASIPPEWWDQKGFVLHLDAVPENHFPEPAGKTSPSKLPPAFSYYAGEVAINGQPAAIGTEIAVFDNNGVLCGVSRVTEAGKYAISIYGDRSDTLTVDEGTTEGGKLTFKVWDRSTGIEYGGNSLIVRPGPAIGSYVPAANPPVWSDNAGYVLNIDVLSITPGDVNGDGQVNLADVILALQALTGQQAASSSALKQADVNGDMKIGLEELIFVLQKAAQLR